jgi:DNA-binding FadR family transcriptional regulator
VVDLHDDQSVLEIFAVRRILEPAASGLAARNADEEAVAQLREVVASVDQAADVESLVEHDLEFHRGIAEATGNTYLASLIDSLSSHTVRARIWRGITQENAVGRTLQEHHAILDAIAAGDADLAHVSGLEQWLRSAL